MPKLKVFRTVSGFHDSYVAAPSRAAALRAWGASTDLFAMGAAEEVKDPKLMKAALEKPGVVFRVKRGAADATPVERKATAKPTRPPSRKRLDKAEQALDEARRAGDAALAEIDANIAKLDEQRRKLIATNERDVAKRQAAVDRAREEYSAARHAADD